MPDHDLGPALLEQFKALRAFIGREDMLMVSGSLAVIDALLGHVDKREGFVGARRCPAGHTHAIEGLVFGVPFCVCPMAPEGQVWILDNRRMPQ